MMQLLRQLVSGSFAMDTRTLAGIMLGTGIVILVIVILVMRRKRK